VKNVPRGGERGDNIKAELKKRLGGGGTKPINPDSWKGKGGPSTKVCGVQGKKARRQKTEKRKKAKQKGRLGGGWKKNDKKERGGEKKGTTRKRKL